MGKARGHYHYARSRAGQFRRQVSSIVVLLGESLCRFWAQKIDLSILVITIANELFEINTPRDIGGIGYDE